jgi:predicted nucleotidyltransferase
MNPSIAQHSVGISAICRRYGIHRLEVFGSAARGSDLDSLDQPDATLEALWAKESEDRLGAYRRDEIKAIAHQHRKPDYWRGRL